MDEVLVAHPYRTIGEREAHRLDHRVHRLRGTEAEALRGITQREALEFQQHLSDRKPARRRRRHRGELVAAISHRDRLADHRVVVGKVRQCHPAEPLSSDGRTAALDGSDDGLRDLALVEDVRTLLRDQTERRRQILSHQEIAFLERYAAGTENRRGFRLQRRDAAVIQDVCCQELVDVETVIRDFDRRLHRVAERDRPVVLERGVDNLQRPRHADGDATGRRKAEQLVLTARQ